MTTLNKIDPHHHLWELSQIENSTAQSTTKETFIGDVSDLYRDYLLEDYLRDIQNQNVVKSVVIQAGWNPSEPLQETKWLQNVANENGFPNGIVGFADLSLPNVESTLAAQCQFPSVRGIRQILSWHDNPDYRGAEKDYIEMPEWRKNFSLLAKYDLSFDMQIFAPQMPRAAEVAGDNPGIQIIINHSGFPLFESEEDVDTWRQNLKLLADLPNIAIKISGLGMFNHHWDVEDIRPIVRTIIDTFGIERCMFASNFPVDSLYSDYDTIFNAYSRIVEDLNPNEQDKLFYKNAASIYRI